MGLRPGLFNPRSAPAAPVQTWGTRPGGEACRRAQTEVAVLTAHTRTSHQVTYKPNPLDGCPMFAPAQPGHYVG